jgi:hypothetical protein
MLETAEAAGRPVEVLDGLGEWTTGAVEIIAV